MSEQLSIHVRKGDAHFYALVKPPIPEDSPLFGQFMFRAEAVQETQSGSQIFVFEEGQFYEKTRKNNGRGNIHLSITLSGWPNKQNIAMIMLTSTRLWSPSCR